MSTKLIIDGYNLMHAMGLVRGKLVGKQLEGARSRMLRRLGFQLTREERGAAIVVFDAKSLLPVSSREELIEGFRVLYPEPGHEADELIEHLVAQDLQPRKLRIVSSDRRLHRAARERMAASVNCDRFLDELDARKPAPENPPPVETVKPPVDLKQVSSTSRPPQKPAPVEVNYWMKEFGDVEIPTDVDLPTELDPTAPSPPESSKPTSSSKAASIKTPAGQSGSMSTESAGQSSASRPTKLGIEATPLKKKPAQRRREIDLDAPTQPANTEKRDPELEFWERELKQILDRRDN